MEHTRKPEYVRGITDTFQSTFLTGPYIAFHYRYDAGEWSSVCSKPQQGRKGEVCVVLEKTGSKGLALALSRFILQTNAFIAGSSSKVRHSRLYVATPPTEALKIKEVMMMAKTILAGEQWTLDVVTTLDTADFLDQHYSGCELTKHKQEVLSLVEQELTYRGDYFIFSELSGWSANVRKERIMEAKGLTNFVPLKIVPGGEKTSMARSFVSSPIQLASQCGHSQPSNILKSIFVQNFF